MGKKRVSAGFNLFMVAVVVAMFAVSIYFLYLAQKGPTVIIPTSIFKKTPEVEKREMLESMEKKYSGKFIGYEDAVYGYKLKYPIGYDARIDPFYDIHQRFVAYYPPFSIELMDIRILNPGEASEAEIKGLANSLNTPLNTQTINGKTAYTFTASQPSLSEDNESVYIRQAFFRCANSSGYNYWLSYTAAISEQLSPDLEVAEYMIQSIQC